MEENKYSQAMLKIEKFKNAAIDALEKVNALVSVQDEFIETVAELTKERENMTEGQFEFACEKLEEAQRIVGEIDELI